MRLEVNQLLWSEISNNRLRVSYSDLDMVFFFQGRARIEFRAFFKHSINSIKCLFLLVFSKLMGRFYNRTIKLSYHFDAI